MVEILTKFQEKMKRFVLSVVLFGFVFSCQQVGEILNPKKLPELDEQGIVVSQDNVMPQDTIWAVIHATNPLNGPLEYEWHCDGGRYMQPADGDSVFWIAPLNGGLYQLWVVVRNEDGASESPRKRINVVSTSAPVVNFILPRPHDYFVVSQTLHVQIRAQHENGIAQVRLWVNDSLIGRSDTAQDDLYDFYFTAEEKMVGESLLKAEAIANNQWHTTGTDQVTILIGGVLPGGNEQR